MKTRTLKITFESDWQIGSGAGIPGSVDRQVLRDEDGLPFVPAKTLTGILRDAAEWIVDNGGGKLAELVELFGTQSEAHGDTGGGTAQKAGLSVRPARFSKGLRAVLSGSPELRDALFLVEPHVKISADTGRAEDDHLFSLEQVRAGIPLYAELTLEEGVSNEAQTLLEKAVKAVRHMGGKRRRGAGKCKLELLQNDWADVQGGRAPENEKLCTAEWQTLPVTLTAEEPLQIGLEVLGNTVKTRDYIPGYLLLPHVAKALGGDAGKWLASGELQVSDLTPSVDGKPGLPMPMCLFKRKEAETETVYNRATITPPKKKQLRGMRSGYVATAEQALLWVDTGKAKTLRMHNTVEDASQRPTETVGGVFSYEVMRRGLEYRGEIRCTKEVAKRLSEAVVAGPVRLGRSKKDDYGKATLTLGTADPLGAASPELKTGETLLVYLESDVLLRDHTLAYSADPRVLKSTLKARLGVKLELKAKGDIAAVGRGRRHDTWQNSWRLPRPSLVALQAGSVFVFEVGGKTTEEAQEADWTFLQKGLGERRAEGFGRLQVNPAWLQSKNGEITLESRALTFAAADGGQCDTEETTLLDELQKDMWRRKLRRIAREKAFGMAESGIYLKAKEEKKLSASQWGSLREVAARLGDDQETAKKRLLFWADSRKATGATNGEDPWPNRRIDKWGKLRGAIISLAQDNTEVWKHYGLDEPPRELWAFAVRTLLDYICEAAIHSLRKKTANDTPAGNRRAGN